MDPGTLTLILTRLPILLGVAVVVIRKFDRDSKVATVLVDAIEIIKSDPVKQLVADLSEERGVAKQVNKLAKKAEKRNV